MADKLVTIAQFADYIQADLARQFLADFGIRAVVTGQNAANIYSGLPAIAAATLQVMESQAAEALKILESDKKSVDETHDDKQEQ